METVDYLYEVMSKVMGNNVSAEELISVYYSLKSAVDSDQYLELYNVHDKFCGFLTWEIRSNKDNPYMIDLGINNLIILQQERGTYNLLRATNYLRNKYPNVASFVWKNRKTKELNEFKQRGLYAKDIQENLQPTR